MFDGTVLIAIRRLLNGEMYLSQKIGAHLRLTVRKVWISFSSAYPYQELFLQVHQALTGRQAQAQAP